MDFQPRPFSVENYLHENVLHQFTRSHSRFPPGLGTEEAFRTIQANFPEGTVDSKMMDCVRSARPKDPKTGLKDSYRAMDVAEANAAVARCLYDENGEPGEEMIQVLTNRIEVIMKAESKGIDFESLLENVDYVLSLRRNRGDVPHHRLFYVRGLCLGKLRRFDEALVEFDEAREHFAAKEGSSSFEAMMFKNTVKKMEVAIRKSMKEYEASSFDGFLSFPEKVEQPSSDHPGLSSSVRIVKMAFIKKAVADRRIETGEVVAVERAVSASPYLTDISLSFLLCDACVKSVQAPIPCPQCCDVIFCSKRCLADALASYHPYECHIAMTRLVRDWNVDKAITISYPAARMLLVKPHADFKVHLEEDLHPNPLMQKNLYLQRYFQVLTVAWMRIIRWSGYVQPVPTSEEFSEIELRMCAFLRKCIEQIWCEAMPILDPDKKCISPGLDLELRQVGSGLFPVIRGHFRHSCAQNVVRVFNGSTQLVVAARNIDEGEELTVNYLTNLNLTRGKRARKVMTSFGHTCHCPACTSNWPNDTDVCEDIPRAESLKHFVQFELATSESRRFPLVWLDSLKGVSSLLEEIVESRDMYCLHAATNPELMRCMHYVYGLVKIDPTCK